MNGTVNGYFEDHAVSCIVTPDIVRDKVIGLTIDILGESFAHTLAFDGDDMSEFLTKLTMRS